jgi:Flp pilus assembly pilin Flp
MSDVTTSAQDRARELAIRARVAMHDVARRAHDLAERGKDERGQTAAEYMGILLIVSVIIAALFGSGIGGWIVNGAEDLIQDIAKGNDDGADTGN